MADAKSKIASASAVMAAGTMVSRITGYGRSILLVAALGEQLHADLFNIGNTVPNMLYILLAGGVFNAVLVPQLVRAQENDADRGEGYTNRIVTLAALFLGGVTVLLVAAAPWLMDLYLSDGYDAADRVEHKQSIVDFARYCLPQVFFYGMFVLVGQILNARGKFGPMMWAPIANNVISVLVLVIYLVAFGPASGSEIFGAYTTNQELLLGLGATAGIAAQLIILVPFLRSVGFHFRPRFDFRNTGLGHTLRLGMWTVLFVIVNQIAYTVVVRLASGGTVGGSSDPGTGYTVYTNAFLIAMVPHSIITVSLATAVLPRLSARAGQGDLSGMATGVMETLRTALALVLPFAAVMWVVRDDLARVLFGYGAASSTYENFSLPFALFSSGLVFFTVHYLMLRGFYAMEQTKRVFYVQVVIAIINIGVGITLVRATDSDFTTPALIISYSLAYAVGSLLSYALLARTVGGLNSRSFLGFGVRALATAGLAAAFGFAAMWGMSELWTGEISRIQTFVRLTTTGLAAGIGYLIGARLLKLSEVTEIAGMIGNRLPTRRRA